MNRLPSVTSEVKTYWRQVLITLHQRNLLRDPKNIPQTDVIVCDEFLLFDLDMQHLGGIRRERWLDEKLWAQIGATLKRPVFVDDHEGLGMVIGRKPRHALPRLPKVIPLAQEHLSGNDYQITLGHDRRGPVELNLAEVHRGILIGGATRNGKSNCMQTILLQLIAKHTPEELQVAIVDPKEVDFARWDGVPHLFAPVARDVESATKLLERIEGERLQRKQTLRDAGVVEWVQMGRDQRPPLIVLVVDEAADLAETAAMETLKELGRKAQGFGISVIVGTQKPTVDAVDTHLRANLETPIAFKTRTASDSRVILDRNGAEALDRPGLALTYIGQRWRKVQVLYAETEMMEDILGDVKADRVVLSEVEQALVRYAVEELDGAFIINKLYEAHKSDISQRQLTKLAKRWELRGWLTEPEHATAPRCVTGKLQGLAYTKVPQRPKSGDR